MLAHWLLAIRPKTLPVSLTPVLVGGALAFADDHSPDILTWLITLLSAGLIQAGTNLHNDAVDFERGTDTPARIGPRRVTAAGLLDAARVTRAAAICFGLAFIAGVYLAWVGGWPIVVIGLSSLVAGYTYTGGPLPIAYTPLGELFVLAFFGIIAVSGTYYLQTLTFSWLAVLAGLIPGLPAAALLLINNYRDLDTDREAGRRTLIHYTGREVGHWVYGALLLLPLPLGVLLNPSTWGWLPILSLPLALRLVYRLAKAGIDTGLNELLGRTVQYQLLLGVLFSLGLLLGST